MTPRLKTKYNEEITSVLKTEFNYTNDHQIPKITKVVLNMGLGAATQNPKIIEDAQNELTMIAGQHAVVTRAKRSIATFKLREGMPIGASVTLRRDRMWEFLDRLITVAIPRIRDFRGVNWKAFDGRGNYSLGLTEQIIFPEIDYDRVNRINGMNISFVTSAKTNAEGRALLRHIGMPFARA